MIKVTVIFHEGDVGRDVTFCATFQDMLSVIEGYEGDPNVVTILCENVDAV